MPIKGSITLVVIGLSMAGCMGHKPDQNSDSHFEMLKTVATSPETSESAIQAFGGMSSIDRIAILARALRDTSSQVRLGALAVSSSFPPADTLTTASLEILKVEKDSAVRYVAIGVLGQWLPMARDKRIISAMISSLSDSSMVVKKESYTVSGLSLELLEERVEGLPTVRLLGAGFVHRESALKIQAWWQENKDRYFWDDGKRKFVVRQ